MASGFDLAHQQPEGGSGRPWKPGRRFATAALVILGGSLVSFATPVPATAVSCHQPPGWTPEAIVTDREPPDHGKRFFDDYDAAVIGEVRGIVTKGDSQSGYGRTFVTVDADAMVGAEADGGTITVTSPDPGWNSGYRFREGRTYFIPLRFEGPKDLRNYSEMCDPIAEIDSPERVDKLAAAAQDRGWSVSPWTIGIVALLIGLIVFYVRITSMPPPREPPEQPPMGRT